MSDEPLYLRRTVIGGDALKNDYVVVHKGRAIGRIRHTAERTGQWDWAINPPLPVLPWGHGSEGSLDDAKAALKAAWARFYATLTADDIAQARQNLQDRPMRDLDLVEKAVGDAQAVLHAYLQHGPPRLDNKLASSRPHRISVPSRRGSTPSPRSHHADFTQPRRALPRQTTEAA
jgi:hypothetical protein